MTTRNLSEPMKLLAALIDAGRFHHDGNLATVWMFANVEVFEDRNENMFPPQGQRRTQDRRGRGRHPGHQPGDGQRHARR